MKLMQNNCNIGMDFLGDSSDDEQNEVLSLQQCLAAQLLVQIAQLHAILKQDIKLAIVVDNSEDILICELREKLRPLKWVCADVIDIVSCASSASSVRYEIVIDMTSVGSCQSDVVQATDEEMLSYGHTADSSIHYTPSHLLSYNSLVSRAGYLLLLLPSSSAPLLPIYFYRQHSDATTNNITIHVMFRYAVDCNTTAAIYWGATTEPQSAINAIGDAVPLSNLANEMKLLDAITIRPSSSTIAAAAHVLSSYGILLIPNLFDKETCVATGRGALEDYALCSAALKTRGINPLCPSEGPAIPNYYELSMREKGRCDMRNTPFLNQLTSSHMTITSNAYNTSNTYNNNTTDACHDVFRRNEFIRSVLSLVMDSKRGEYYKGNWGRWNFEKGGPEAEIEITAGKIGVVVSLPGCEDQTIHADTAQLFSGDAQLPAHYVNLFIPTVSEKDNHLSVGQTAFIATSHLLSRCDWFMNGGEDGEREMMRYLVRPHLQAGDALLFDCRILHFGLANKSNSDDSDGVIRPLLYVNYHHTWFNDPKNWNDRIRLINQNSDNSQGNV